jgi:hypothetical protein
MPMVRPRLRLKQVDNRPQSHFFLESGAEPLWKTGIGLRDVCGRIFDLYESGTMPGVADAFMLFRIRMLEGAATMTPCPS